MDIDHFRREFAHVGDRVVHLNHAGVSCLSARSVSAMIQAIHRQSREPLGFFNDAVPVARQCRSRLAQLMGIDPIDLAFTKNTAHGLSIIADGFDWRQGDEVVFADCEYPANSYPWLAQQDRGVICKPVATRSDGTVPVEDYAAALTKRTRILAVSWVQFRTGYRADLAALADLAHSHGAMIVVDVIQGLGAFPLNLSAAGVDAAATGSQKWLIGPMGVGGLYVHPRMLGHLRLVNMGAGASNMAGVYETLEIDPKPSVQRYEEGTWNIFGYYGLNAALEMLEEAGVEAICARVLQIAAYAMRGLEAHDYIVDSPALDSIRSGIVMFHHESYSAESIVESLAAAKVNAVNRGARVRFAPHFYTSEDDIDRALDALP